MARTRNAAYAALILNNVGALTGCGTEVDSEPLDRLQRQDVANQCYTDSEMNARRSIVEEFDGHNGDVHPGRLQAATLVDMQRFMGYCLTGELGYDVGCAAYVDGMSVDVIEMIKERKHGDVLFQCTSRDKKGNRRVDYKQTFSL
ncbi:TPA: hypothetical protein HA241_00100 [Candidatus Woesearchaeota archaeon]|nr:hypothetical protein [Candidatus Woesearchaeota archaeon]